jgi:hypothetical protein
MGREGGGRRKNSLSLYSKLTMMAKCRKLNRKCNERSGRDISAFETQREESDWEM